MIPMIESIEVYMYRGEHGANLDGDRVPPSNDVANDCRFQAGRASDRATKRQLHVKYLPLHFHPTKQTLSPVQGIRIFI